MADILEFKRKKSGDTVDYILVCNSCGNKTFLVSVEYVECASCKKKMTIIGGRVVTD